MDKWDRKTNFNCDSCRYYVPKPNYGTNLGACRKNAPTMTGYPVVNAELDWCGEHKIGSNPVRDGKIVKEPKPPTLSSPKIMQIRSCPKHTHYMFSDCPHCRCDIGKVFGLIHWQEEKSLPSTIDNTTDVEEAKIKAEIKEILNDPIKPAIVSLREYTDPAVTGQYLLTLKYSTARIKKLLEKL